MDTTTTPTPMTKERLEELRRRAQQVQQKFCLSDTDELEMLAEIDRLKSKANRLRNAVVLYLQETDGRHELEPGDTEMELQ